MDKSGAIKQHVQRSDPRYRALNRRPVRHVQQQPRYAVNGVEFADRRFVDIRREHGGAFSGARFGAGASNPLPRCADQHFLSGQAALNALAH